MLLYIGLFRFASFLDDPSWSAPPKGYGSTWLFSWIGSSSTTADILALLLLFIQAILINYLVGHHKLTYENSMFPGIVYVLLMSFFPEFQHLSPILLASTFLLIGLSDVFECYQKGDAANNVFNAGLMLALATFFYAPAIYLILAFYLGFVSLKSFRIKEILQFVIGFAIPHFLLFVIAYWNDTITDYVQFQWVQPFGIIQSFPMTNRYIFLKIGLFLVLMLASFINYSNLSTKTYIHVKKKLDVTYWLMVIAAAGIFLQPEFTLADFQILCIPLAIFMGATLLQIKNKLLAEIIHLLILGMILSLQYLLY